MAKHAFLAASASERWLRCPPSAKLCAQEEDLGSPYAQQGTDAHELCQYLLEKALGRETKDPTEDLTWYNTEMQEAAEGYTAFVMEQVQEARTRCPDPLVCVEQTVDFSKWVEHGFGTADALIVADDLLYITDFKFGLGCLVRAAGEDGNGNSQLKCYALGALDTFGDLYDIQRIRLSIYQPRRENIDTFELTKADLLKWADEVLAPIARLAYEGRGEFEAGDHCQFCKVKATCRKRSEYAMELAKYEFADAGRERDRGDPAANRQSGRVGRGHQGVRAEPGGRRNPIPRIQAGGRTKQSQIRGRSGSSEDRYRRRIRSLRTKAAGHHGDDPTSGQETL